MNNKTKKGTGKFIFVIVVLVLMLCVSIPLAFQTTSKNNENTFTAQDVQDAHDQGYNSGVEDKNAYELLISGYRTQIDDLNRNIESLNKQLDDNKTTISELESIKTTNEQTIIDLMQSISSNEQTISGLNIQIDSLNSEVKKLENLNETNTEEITRLNTQVTTLQNLVNQLQITNDLNLTTITNLNNQIKSLNSQMSDLIFQGQNYSSDVTTLNNKIAELEQSIAYYEQYIASLESGEQVVATFEFNGSVYSIQILSKGAYASVTTPTSTDYVIFNYWTVNGEQVELSTYPVNTNTKFIANVTKKYDVKFMVDNSEYDCQLVVENGYATLPSVPTKDGYEFDGWSLNGVDVIENISSTAVTQNVTYTAVFTKLHTVTFMFDGEVKSTQNVRNGNSSTNVDIASTTYVVFNGWTLNGVIVDVTTQPIYSDTTFVADITRYYDVTFMIDDAEYDHQIVVENGYATLPAVPEKDEYDFVGWSLNGVDVVEISYFQINSNNTFTAIFTFRPDFYSVSFNGDMTTLTGSDIWIANGDAYYSSNAEHYKFVYETMTWEEITWTMLNYGDVYNFGASDVWTDGVDYYVNGYKLDFDNYTVDGSSLVSLPTGFSASNVWTDGISTYYSSGSRQYVFDTELKKWSKISFNGDTTNLDGEYIFNDGVNTYCIYSAFYTYMYKFDKSTLTWEEVDSVYGRTDLIGISFKNINNKLYYLRGGEFCFVDVENNELIELPYTISISSGVLIDYIWGVNDTLFFSSYSGNFVYKESE